MYGWADGRVDGRMHMFGRRYDPEGHQLFIC